MRQSMRSAAWVAVGNYANIAVSFLVFIVPGKVSLTSRIRIVAVATVFLDVLLVVARGGCPMR